MNKQDIINSAKMVRQSFKHRAGRMTARAAGAFALAYGGGFILSSIISPFFTQYLAFLNIGVYGGLTVLGILLGTLFTYPTLVIVNRQLRTQD